MSGLVGKKVGQPDILQKSFAATPVTVVQNLIGKNDPDCKLFTGDCVDPDIIRCPSGQHKVGWDKAGCKVSKISLKDNPDDSKMLTWYLLHRTVANSSAAPVPLRPNGVPVRLRRTLFGCMIDADHLTGRVWM